MNSSNPVRREKIASFTLDLYKTFDHPYRAIHLELDGEQVRNPALVKFFNNFDQNELITAIEDERTYGAFSDDKNSLAMFYKNLATKGFISNEKAVELVRLVTEEGTFRITNTGKITAALILKKGMEFGHAGAENRYRRLGGPKLRLLSNPALIDLNGSIGSYPVWVGVETSDITAFGTEKGGWVEAEEFEATEISLAFSNLLVV